ncbi:hypothetical protein AEAC466_09980 [Asticcacaulis sp. AC466]|nr:hypothetical protein [Asticcacaulis sp. AC466]ESQ84064.1 hypothetical protein AEAC466_09980 [Asticcacaulis sp. AC466]
MNISKIHVAGLIGGAMDINAPDGAKALHFSSNDDLYADNTVRS